MRTENLTKRWIDLLNRAKGLRSINVAWTSDGRIICLLGNGGCFIIVLTCSARTTKLGISMIP